MAPEMLPAVFDLFVQAERTMDRSQGGLGIGLTLVRTIAQLHGGSVLALSDGPGRGSEFIVSLPLLKSGRETAGIEAAVAPGDRARATRRVLVVDDNRDAADSMALLLRLGGHDVVIAESGHAALETEREQRPDLVLLDIGLPDVDGYEVARRLRAAGCPAILAALTGYGQPEDRERALEAGFDEHLVKPVDPRALERLLD
jgi:CheY-like chemotaxis protein